MRVVIQAWGTTDLAGRIRVAVVDDHSLVLQGLRTVLAAETDLELVADGATGQEAFRLVADLRPDVLIMDLSLPDGNALELIRQLRGLSPVTQIVVLTLHDDELYVVEALAAGAAGYLLKDSPYRLIALAIRSVHNSGCVLERRLLPGLLRRLAGLERPAKREQDPPLTDFLSQRELDVLRLISQGSSNRVIAGQLHLAEATVKKYVHSLKSKLSVSDRAQAAVVGMRLGLLE